MSETDNERDGLFDAGDRITSFRNPMVRRIKRLRRKKHRREEGVHYVEGLRGVLSALEAKAPVETLVYCPELLRSQVALSSLKSWFQSGRPVARLSAEVFASISLRDNPVGFGALVRSQWTALSDLVIQKDAIILALDGVSEPGNLGTIMRTAEAVGASGLILAGESVDPFNPSAVKASMGTLYSLPLVETGSLDDVLSWAAERDLFTLATSAKAKTVLWEADVRFPALLILGSEGSGLSANNLEKADLDVAIPMYGTASSLNLAVAAGILLYNLIERRNPQRP